MLKLTTTKAFIHSYLACMINKEKLVTLYTYSSLNINKTMSYKTARNYNLLIYSVASQRNYCFKNFKLPVTSCLGILEKPFSLSNKTGSGNNYSYNNIIVFSKANFVFLYFILLIF